MNIFSNSNLLNKRLKEFEYQKKKKGFISSFQLNKKTLFKTSNETLWLKIPYYELLRAEVFIDDLIELTKDENEELNMNVDMLIFLLYKDFLNQIRKGEQLLTLARKLKTKFARNYEIHIEQLERENKYTWIRQEQKKKNREVVEFPLHLDKKQVIRGEVLLYDLSQLDESFALSLEELISLLFIDFVHKLRTEGNEEKTILSILERLGYKI